MDFLLNQNNLYIVLIALASGAMLLWPTLSKGSRKGSVGVAQAVQLANREHGIFLDIRTAEQFQAGTIPQARNLPNGELEAKLASLPKDKPIIVFCDQGRESAGAAAKLRKQGLAGAVSLEGGLRGWNQAGMPLTKKA